MSKKTFKQIFTDRKINTTHEFRPVENNQPIQGERFQQTPYWNIGRKRSVRTRPKI